MIRQRAARRLLRAALAYAARGWPVFPLDGKRPFGGSHGHHDATANPARLKALFAKYRDANGVAVACGRASNLVVVDVDGPDGERSLRELGPLPATREATSGRPHRRHLFYTCPEAVRVKRTIKVLPGLDVLGDGGYCVLAPSYCPATRGVYRWLNDRPLAPLPERIVRLVNGRDTKGTSRKNLSTPLPDVIPEGRRDDFLTSLAGTMRRRGMTEGAILAALKVENARCQPPLPDSQLVKIARSIARYAPADRHEPLDDIGNARRFVRLHGEDVRYVPAWRCWLVWL